MLKAIDDAGKVLALTEYGVSHYIASSRLDIELEVSKLNAWANIPYGLRIKRNQLVIAVP